ncbi:MAG: GtrA family protein [Clostridia bacterium]|nr:GtrA family protein [Clostridia bacterium]
MKLNVLWNKWREVIMYLIFGVLTTVVGVGTYTLVFAVAEHGLRLDLSDKTSALYLGVYAAAQVIHWIAAVLFAFFTNKKWVFTDARPEPLWRQLSVFAASRLVTLGLDVVITYVGVLALAALWPDGLTVIIHFSVEFMAKVIASFVVIIANYVISKLFVFRK